MDMFRGVREYFSQHSVSAGSPEEEKPDEVLLAELQAEVEQGDKEVREAEEAIEAKKKKYESDLYSGYAHDREIRQGRERSLNEARTKLFRLEQKLKLRETGS